MFGNDTKFETRSISRGDILAREGEALGAIFILTSGRILNFSINNGRVIPLHMSTDSGVIGEDCILGQHKVCSYSSIAMSDSKVLVIPKESISRVIYDSSDWIKNLISNISERSINTSKIIVEHKIKADALNGDQPFENEDEKFILSQLSKTK